MALHGRAILLALLLSLLLGACGKDSPTETPSINTLELWDECCTIQIRAAEFFDSLVVSQDTQSAIDATLEFLQGSSEQVEWAVYNGASCICIGYRQIGGGLIAVRDPEGKGGSSKNVTMNGPALDGGVIPTKEGAIICAPYYEKDFGYYDSAVYDKMRDELPKVGFPVGAIGIVTDQLVTPETFASLDGMGVVHISSHGIPYPDTTNPEEVFLATDLPSDPSMNSKYEDDLFVTLWPYIPLPDGGRHETYGILPGFVAKYNQDNWHESHPIVWGGFCWGFLCGWPGTMVGAGASCYIGWDSAVSPALDCSLACEFYGFMCDTPATDPFASTIGAFFGKYYTDHLCWFGNAFTSFQEVVSSEWRVGPHDLAFNWQVAAWDSAKDELDIVLQNMPSGEPSIVIALSSVSELEIGYPTIPWICCYGGSAWSYDNSYWESKKDPRPCYIWLTELELEQLGKVSGCVSGYVYDVYDPDEIPVPITGTLENISIYVGMNCSGRPRVDSPVVARGKLRENQ